MRKILFLFAMLVTLNCFAIGDVDKVAIKSVVSSHMVALKNGNFNAAWGLLTENKRKYGSADEFGKMLGKELPMLIRNNVLQYGEAFVEKGKVVQPVILEDIDGNVWIAAFIMAIEGDGWKLDGVFIYKTKNKGI